MKILNYLILGTAALTLAACGGSSSGNGNGVTDIYTLSLDPQPTAKPANAASTEESLNVLKKIRYSQTLLPSSDLIFQSVLSTGEKQSAKEREKDLKLLSSGGDSNLQKIKAACAISSPPATVEGDAASRKTTLTRSLTGERCPTLRHEKHESMLRRIDHKQFVRTFSYESNATHNMSVDNSKLTAFSTTKAGELTLKSVGTLEFAGEDLLAGQKAKFLITGTINYTMTDNETIKINLSADAVSKKDSQSKKTQTTFIMEINSPAGMIRLVSLFDSTATPQIRTYLNGEEADPKIFTETFNINITQD